MTSRLGTGILLTFFYSVRKCRNCRLTVIYLAGAEKKDLLTFLTIKGMTGGLHGVPGEKGLMFIVVCNIRIT